MRLIVTKVITLALSHGMALGNQWLQHSLPLKLNEMIASHEWKWKYPQTYQFIGWKVTKITLSWNNVNVLNSG